MSELLETVYFNRGETSLVADFPASLSSLCDDRRSYGLAMNDTLNTLGISSYYASAQRVLFGGAYRVLDCLPALEVAADTIASKASYEQDVYNRAEAQTIRSAVKGVLARLVEVLPEPAQWNDTGEVCGRVVLAFAQAIAPEGTEVRVAHNEPAPWRITEDERVYCGLSVADGAEHYLQALGGK